MLLTNETGFDRLHTLVITTHDRPAFLERLLRHLVARCGVRGLSPGRVLVADSSSHEARAYNAARCRELPYSVRHLVLPPEIEVREQFAAAIRAVDTPYQTFLGDDDLLEADFLPAAVAVLESEPAIAAVQGREFSLCVEQGIVSIALRESRGTRPLRDGLSRFLDLFANYAPAEFATRRTEVAQATLPLLDVFALDEALGEPLHGAAAALFGEVRTLDAVGVLRLSHDSSNARRSYDRRLSIAASDFSAALAHAAESLQRLGFAAAERAPDAPPCSTADLSDVGRGDPLRTALAEAQLRHIAAYPGYFGGLVAGTQLAVAHGRLGGAVFADVAACVRLHVYRHLLGLDESAAPCRAAAAAVAEDPLVVFRTDGRETARLPFRRGDSGELARLAPDRAAAEPARFTPDQAASHRARAWCRAVAHEKWTPRWHGLRAQLLAETPLAELVAAPELDSLLLRIVVDDLAGWHRTDFDPPEAVAAALRLDEPGSGTVASLRAAAAAVLVAPEPSLAGSRKFALPSAVGDARLCAGIGDRG